MSGIAIRRFYWSSSLAHYLASNSESITNQNIVKSPCLTR